MPSRELIDLNQQQNGCSTFAADLEYFCLFRIFLGKNLSKYEIKTAGLSQ